jgi:hypothetical protein
MNQNQPAPNRGLMWQIWKISFNLVVVYLIIDLSAAFLGFPLMPFTLPAVLYLGLSWLALKFIFKQNSW